MPGHSPRPSWALAPRPPLPTTTYLGVALAHAPDDTPDHHDTAHGVEGAVDLGPVVAHEECAEGQQEEPQHDEADAEGLLISHCCLARPGLCTTRRGAPVNQPAVCTRSHRRSDALGSLQIRASGKGEGGSLRVQLSPWEHQFSRLEELRLGGHVLPPSLPLTFPLGPPECVGIRVRETRGKEGEVPGVGP